ncbi:glycosyltransferase family 39 protein [Candidatus Woesearchaeota archaeon]|nr:glycosyltransferase family 39 protein [Candidatus Woesearchaeota archaeon]
MGDDVVEQRKENVKKFLNDRLKLDNKTLIYIGIYLLLVLLAYLKFGDSFRIGKNFVFIITPILGVILFLFRQKTLAILISIISFSFILRLQNLPFLIDITTNMYIPADPDAMAFMRYAKYILEHGSIMGIDPLRYYPYGFSGTEEFSFLANFIVYLYKFLNIFSSSFTLELVDVIYPPIAFAISMIFFFLLVKKLFNDNISLLSTAFLAVIPSYLFRTLTGISDKEALATVFFYAAFYFYVSAWQSEKIKNRIISGSLAGLSTGLTTLIWGGGGFIFIIIGIFTLIELLLNKIKKIEFYSYLSWLFSSILFLRLLFPDRFGLDTFILSTSTSIAMLVLFIWVIDYLIFDLNLLKIKGKLENKFPEKIFSLIISLLIIFIAIIIIYDLSFIYDRISIIFNTLLKAFAGSRWVKTVAENSQPYLTDWISDFGKTYFWMFLIGSVLLFHDMIKSLKNKYIWWFVLIYVFFLFGITFSRYSSNSNLNGISQLSIILYIGSLLTFILFIIISYLYSFYKDRELFDEILKFDKLYTFVFVWFIIMIIAGRSAVRLLFIFSPITAVLASYLVFKVVDYIKNIFKINFYRYSGYVVVGILTLLILSGFVSSSLGQASGVGPTYNQQWQHAGKWIREDTPENSIFSHWWDYGYLVQYNNRATISDGGNAGGYDVNYFTGRHVLTGQNEKEALEYLKSRNVTHFLAVSDEIGKYPAYSSIGSDVNYDRYSWITTFGLDQKQTRETRNETILVYSGGFPLDEDLIYNNKVYPRQAAGIGAILVPLILNNEQIVGINQPKAILVYNGEQIELPLTCLYMNNEKYEFVGSLNGCLRIIPTINNNQVNNIGAGLYLSPRVKESLFAQLYLFDKKTDNFKLVYTDEPQVPLSIYNGRLIGPYKIWEVSYPEDLKVPGYFYKRELPDERVTKVKEGF